MRKYHKLLLGLMATAAMTAAAPSAVAHETPEGDLRVEEA